MQTVSRSAVGRCEELVGAVRVDVGAEHAGHHELGVGEPLAEHAHERDRPALAARCGRACRSWPATPLERRRPATARTPARSTRAGVSAANVTVAPYGGSVVSACASAPVRLRGRRWAAGARQLQRRRGPQHVAGHGDGGTHRRRHGQRRSPRAVQQLLDGSSAAGRAPAPTGTSSRHSGQIGRGRGGLAARSAGTRRAARAEGPRRSPRPRHGRAASRRMRKVDGTTPLARRCAGRRRGPPPASRRRPGHAATSSPTGGRSRGSPSRGTRPGSASRGASASGSTCAARSGLPLSSLASISTMQRAWAPPAAWTASIAVEAANAA